MQLREASTSTPCRRSSRGLIAKYSAAQALAPADRKDDYASVLRYLVQAKKAVDSRDLEQIKTMVKNLSSLNATMASIQTQSQQLCG